MAASSAYRDSVPAHLFPQWGFALTGKTLEGLSYPMLAAMNGGVKLVQNAPLPANRSGQRFSNRERWHGKLAFLQCRQSEKRPSAL